MKSYRDDSLEFSARDVAAEDRVRQQLKAEDQGVLIESVSEGGWAALAHLAVGDLVFEVDGQPTPTIAVFEARMRQVVANKPETIVLRVRRGIHTLHIELTPKWVDSNAPGSQDGWR
jgi:S1-C subfamily serine protease